VISRTVVVQGFVESEVTLPRQAAQNDTLFGFGSVGQALRTQEFGQLRGRSFGAEQRGNHDPNLDERPRGSNAGFQQATEVNVCGLWRIEPGVFLKQLRHRYSVLRG
jgi:hypothetical protein